MDDILRVPLHNFVFLIGFDMIWYNIYLKISGVLTLDLRHKERRCGGECMACWVGDHSSHLLIVL
jgi:hypothetical protein